MANEDREPEIFAAIWREEESNPGIPTIIAPLIPCDLSSPVAESLVTRWLAVPNVKPPCHTLPLELIAPGILTAPGTLRLLGFVIERSILDPERPLIWNSSSSPSYFKKTPAPPVYCCLNSKVASELYSPPPTIFIKESWGLLTGWIVNEPVIAESPFLCPVW